ncbi:mitochondrial chaperone [Novymonas esmeraldas]|uniref:Mitochondrial chaperone n=1 Tax=Novymonas esmeraldas TaxID=1808958 RepID=A0AAW0ER56_9TRYP
MEVPSSSAVAEPDAPRVFGDAAIACVTAWADRAGEVISHAGLPLPLLLSLLVVLTPLLLSAVRVLWPLGQTWVGSKCAHRLGAIVGGLGYIERHIIVLLPPFPYVDVDNDNVLLQNAVVTYLCNHLWRRRRSHHPQHSPRSYLVYLIDPYRTWRAWVTPHSPFQAGAPVGRADELDDDAITPTAVDRLCVTKLPHRVWTPTTYKNVDMYFDEVPLPLTDYSKPWTQRTLTLRCPTAPGAAASLDSFVQRALEVFAEGAPEKDDVDDKRWFYTYGGESGDAVLFHQYVLRSNKGFDTLFFPQRDATLTLIDHFAQRRGRFAVEGFPQKLGFLVYGPAGTGRHAFVKALAAYTGRHIVSVPLSKLRTNQQLYDIFFVREFKSDKQQSSAQRLRMEDVIFLFDDVDAADSVVCARAARRVVQRRAAARLTARAGPRDAALTNCVIEMDTSSSQRVMSTAESALPLALLMELMGGAGGGAGDGAGGGAAAKEGGAAAKESEPKREPRGRAAREADGGGAVGGGLFGVSDMLCGESKDKLDLAGLLNVLDGVVDAPGRMVVMITEHPEWLDPALIRPGRFSARLRFDYIEMDALVRMLGLYYGDVVHAPPSGDATGVVSSSSSGSGGGVEAARHAAAAAAARVVHRELSEAQVASVRGAVAALEAEAAAAAAAAAAAREAGTASDGAGSDVQHRFHVTPCEVEMLCMEQDDLDGFLAQLSGVVRGTRQL